MQILAAHPGEFPSLRTLQKWRDKYPVFATAWRRAEEQQAWFRLQKVLDLEITPKNAHEVRVRFDIAKWFASKLIPNVYGDKPSETSVSVSNTVVIGEAQINAIRANLDRARQQFESLTDTKKKTEERKALYPESLKEFDKAKHKLNQASRDVNQAQKDATPLEGLSHTGNGESYGNETH